MSRAEKFHHRERLKAKRRHHWGRDLLNDQSTLARAVNTPTPCSCLMCGNRREHEGQTMQERRIELASYASEID